MLRSLWARRTVGQWLRAGVPSLQERAICNSQVLRAQKKPWYYEMSVIFSKEAREERARKLKEEATRGRFHELNEIKENGGKLFEADMDLMKLEDSGAVTFPDVDAWPVVASGGGEPQGPVSLSARLAGKVSLVTVCVRDIARPMVSSWVQAFTSTVAPNDRLQIVQVSFVEGGLYKLIRKWLLSSIKGSMPAEQHDHAMVVFDDSENFRSKLQLKNRLVAYVFLVDAEKRVRWRGCGYALEHEIKAMAKAAANLSHVRTGSGKSRT